MAVAEAGERLGTRATAEWLGVTTGTLSQWRHLGRGPKYVRVSGRKILYRVSDLEAWLSEREVDPEAASR